MKNCGTMFVLGGFCLFVFYAIWHIFVTFIQNEINLNMRGRLSFTIINGAARDLILCQRGNDHQPFSFILLGFYLMLLLFNLLMNSVACVCILRKVCVCIRSLQICYASSLYKLMTLWLWDWNSFRVSSFLNGNSSAKGIWVEQGIAHTHAKV